MFHMGEDLLATLNPGVDLSKAGTKILVAEVKPQPIHGTLKTIVVDKKKSQVPGHDRKGHFPIAYPATDRQSRASLAIGHLQGQRISWRATTRRSRSQQSRWFALHRLNQADLRPAQHTRSPED